MKRPVTLHPFDPLTAVVPLTKGHFALISVIDAPVVGQRNWSLKTAHNGELYAQARRQAGDPGQGGHVSLHRLVADAAGFGAAPQIDHENCNGLDCRRSNLRAATPKQNGTNRRVRRDAKSGVKGVTWVNGRWQARTTIDGKTHYFGTFGTVEEAAEVLRGVRAEHHGEFARN